jgi:hypothetical protein
MPFQSEKQRRYLWANEPEIARDWTDTYGSRIKKDDGGISQLVKSGPGRPGYGGPHETEKAGREYKEAVSRGEGQQHMQQALQQFAQLPSTTSGPVQQPVAPDTRPPQLGGPSTLENALKFKQIQAAQAKQLMTQPGVYDDDEYDFSGENTLLADVSQADINLIKGFRFNKNQEGSSAREVIGMSGQKLNPTITDKEIESVIQGTTTEPTGKFAAEGGRIQKDDGGIARIGLRRGTSGAPGGGDPGMYAQTQADKDVAKDVADTFNERSSKPYEDKIVREHREKKEIRKKQQDTDRGQFFRKKPVVEKSTMGMWVDDVRNKVYQSGLNTRKVSAMRKMSLLSPAAKNVWMAIIQAAGGQVPEWAEDLTEDELKEYAFDIQGIKDYGQATYNPNLNPTKQGSGVELLGRVFEGQDILNRKNMTQAEWDRLFPGNIKPPRDRDGGYMGYPSYAAWLAAQGGGGGGGGTTPPVDEGSDFQDSLTGTADTPDYYVGSNPLASNIAWGKQAGVDPRTMGLTSWAAEGGRVPAAYGGIMDNETGRRAYGFGSFFRKIGRAAKKVIKSPLGKIGIGALAMGMPWGAGATFGNLGGTGWFGAQSGWGRMAPFLKDMALGKQTAAGERGITRSGGVLDWLFKTGKEGSRKWSPWKIGLGAATALPFLMGGGDDDDDDGFDYDATRDAYAQKLRNIKAGVMAGSLNPNEFSYLPSNYTYTGAEGGRAGFDNGGFTMDDSLAEEDRRIKESYKAYERYKASGGTKSYHKFIKMIGVGGLAEGGRIGYYTGKSVPSDYTIEDAVMSTTQDKLGGITDVMKHADLFRKGEVGQMYAADGGRIGYSEGRAGRPPITMGQVPQAPQAPQAPPQMAGALPPTPMPAPQRPPPGQMPPPGINPMAKGNPMGGNPMGGMNPMGGRKMAQEGGLMDLGGMEKDYRNDGGFVPLGGEEKADDVPARLSKNEFVFTADAVRGAGGGDIDAGAEIMENVMENLEEGGNISEESQGLEGAQNMFATAQRLGGVV